MDHLAILAKKRKFLPKIISGKKTIESRWYIHKKAPCHALAVGDRVFFKDSGDPVTVMSEVAKVLFFDNLTMIKIQEILKRYGNDICIQKSYAKNLDGKRYCSLIFLKNVQKITPFAIDKRGYGNMAAWITVENIELLKKK